MNETIYIKTPVSTPPEKSGHYFTNFGECGYSKEYERWPFSDVVWWLKPTTLEELESKKAVLFGRFLAENDYQPSGRDFWMH